MATTVHPPTTTAAKRVPMTSLRKTSVAAGVLYLITFVSIPEGLRADRWLDSQGKRGHVALPVPSEITRRCGVVLGFSGREEAKRTYRLLMDNKFAPEDVYVMEDRGGLSKLMIE